MITESYLQEFCKQFLPGPISYGQQNNFPVIILNKNELIMTITTDPMTEHFPLRGLFTRQEIYNCLVDFYQLGLPVDLPTQWIKWDGTVTDIKPLDLKAGFQLKEEVYPRIDATCVGITHLADGRYMLLDDDGRSIANPVLNKRATELYQQCRMKHAEIAQIIAKMPNATMLGVSGTNPDAIYGSVIVCPLKYFK